MWLAFATLIPTAIGPLPLAEMKDPPISALSAIVLDADTGQVLWSRDAHTPRFPASTTKIVTALLLIERTKPTDVIVAPSDVNTVKEASLNLRPYERVSAGDMLYALIIRSANDASYSVARHVSGSQEAFCRLMNERAVQLGAQNSTFNNPHGLNDPLHKTTAYDLAMIARECMKHEAFRTAAATKQRTITRSINQQDLLLKSHNKFLDAPGAEGIKTGFTNPAGRCFVGSKSVGGWRLIAVVLKSTDWLGDTNLIFDWAYTNFERKQFGKPGERIGTISVLNGAAHQVPGRLERSISYVAERGGLAREPRVVMRPVSAPIQPGQPIGELIVETSAGLPIIAPIVAEHGVAIAPVPKGIPHAAYWIAGGAAALGLIGFRLPWRRRSRKSRRKRRPRHA
jgi:D-alanyl-D-alanine carboxypeptidase